MEFSTRRLSKMGSGEPTGPKPASLEDVSGGVHLLPCTVDYDGPCDISHYFKPKPSGVDREEAYFRGRKLEGATVPLPSGYSGFVIAKKNSGDTHTSECLDKEEEPWELKAKFSRLTYWNHDCLPSHDDAFPRSLHLLAVAEALHKPVMPEDLFLFEQSQKTVKYGHSAV